MSQLRFIHGWTPMPNYLIDFVMPKTSDTEWRILSVVSRQTLGWKDTDSGNRKTTDWLSQNQLKRKTGRQSAAISRALASLIDRGLIVAYNDKAEVLRSPVERRRCRGPMYLSLSPWVRRLSTGIKRKSDL